jgi:hypothetical protein
MEKQNLLILYKEDFERTHIWEDICTILAIPISAESAYIRFDKVEYEYEQQDDLYEHSTK